MKAAIIIPARLKSERLAGKILLAETGIPLICHTAMAAAKIRDMSGSLFRQVIVAADHEDTVRAVEEFNHANNIGVGAVMTRADHASGSDRIAEAAATLDPEIDAILNLQGDEPEIDPEPVLSLAKKMASTDADIGTLAFPVPDAEEAANPNLVKVVMGANGRALYFSRSLIPYPRAEKPFVPYYGHVGIYLYRRAALERFVQLPAGLLEQTEKLEQLRALENGMRIFALTMETKPEKGIDTAEDYAAFVKRIGKAK